MDIPAIENIVDKHAQKYAASCAPSLAEMLLKVKKAVAADYYAEQDRDKDANVGLANIKDLTIAGETFRRVQDTNSQDPFSKQIDGLLEANKPVGIFLQNPNGFHGFVIAGKEKGKYVLISKISEFGKGEGKKSSAPAKTICEAGAFTANHEMKTPPSNHCPQLLRAASGN
ncbi:MAG: hypothetical protein QOE70_4618 [Chthoniobacter sp.]|jgi:hypothetical protein|nr:hypothetical protein [Chthoniobacter sp.]